MNDPGFSTDEAASLLGVSYNRLDRLDRYEIVAPTITPADGSGSRRRWASRDLPAAAVAVRLMDAGARIPVARAAAAALRRSPRALYVIIDGDDVYAVDSDAAVVGAVLDTDGLVTVARVPTISQLLLEAPVLAAAP